MGKKIQIWAFLDNFPYILSLKNHSCDSGSFPIKFICALWLIQFKGTLGNLLTSQTLSEVRSSCGDVSSLVVVLATSIFISVAAVLLFFKFSYSCFVYFFSTCSKSSRKHYFFLFKLCVCVWVCTWVCTHECRFSRRTEENIRFWETGVTAGPGRPDMDPLQERWTLLTAEQFSHPPFISFIFLTPNIFWGPLIASMTHLLDMVKNQETSPSVTPKLAMHGR